MSEETKKRVSEELLSQVTGGDDIRLSYAQQQKELGELQKKEAIRRVEEIRAAKKQSENNQ